MEVGTVLSQTTLTSAERAAVAREGRWQKLLAQVDPDGLMTAEDRENAARKLRREQLTEWGTAGRLAQAEARNQYRLFLSRKDELIRLHEEIADVLRRDPVTCIHTWPDELTTDAECLHCGLAYGEWSE